VLAFSIACFADVLKLLEESGVIDRSVTLLDEKENWVIKLTLLYKISLRPSYSWRNRVRIEVFGSLIPSR